MDFYVNEIKSNEHFFTFHIHHTNVFLQAHFYDKLKKNNFVEALHPGRSAFFNHDAVHALTSTLSIRLRTLKLERACRLLDIGHLSDQKPSELDNKMLNMLEDRDANYIIRGLFLRDLPREVRAIVASLTSELRELAHEANQHFIFRRDGEGCLTNHRDATRNSCFFQQSTT